MNENTVELRIMQESDFPECLRLRQQTGWNQTITDWQRFLSLNPAGCFITTCGDNTTGTACTVPYEDRFGWVSMVIVDQDHQRKGIGTKLLLAGIEHLENCGLTVKLDATPAGKMLYDSLGFHDEYGVARMECDCIQLSGDAIPCPSLTINDLDQLDQYDAPLFGASRKPVLQSYLHHYATYAFCAKIEGRITGYVMAREGGNAFHIGPWVADDASTAQSLLNTVISHRKPERIFIDIIEPNINVRNMLQKMAFKEQRPFIRMYKGVNDNPGKPELIYGLSGPELG